MDEDLFDPRITIREPGSMRVPRALTWGAPGLVRIQRSAMLFTYETVPFAHLNQNRGDGDRLLCRDAAPCDLGVMSIDGYM